MSETTPTQTTAPAAAPHRQLLEAATEKLNDPATLPQHLPVLQRILNMIIPVLTALDELFAGK